MKTRHVPYTTSADIEAVVCAAIEYAKANPNNDAEWELVEQNLLRAARYLDPSTVCPKEIAKD